MRKTVAIVGGGASGLTSIKQLLDEGHQPVCFEKDSDVGGIFNRGAYDNTVLTISNYMMAFSDFPPSESYRLHWGRQQYKKYLMDYAEKFNLKKRIRFNTKVTGIRKYASGYEVESTCLKTKVTSTKYFDAVICCSGTHQIRKMPEIEGLKEFNGTVIHSSEYRNNAPFKGKSVLCIGIGESSSDITREIADVSEDTVLAIRSYPYLIPRILGLGGYDAADAWTSRIEHSRYHCNENMAYYILAYIYSGFSSVKRLLFKPKKPAIDSFGQPFNRDMLDLKTDYDDEALRLIKSWCYLSEGNKFATKNVTFVPYIINKKITVNASGIERISGNTVHFNDGTKKQVDTIVCCTGFKDDFSLIEGFELKDNNVRNLFMNSLHKDWPNLAFIGWARPVTGGIPVCSELTARYFSLLISGKRELPSDMDKQIAEDKRFYEKIAGNSPDINTVVGWKVFTEKMSRLIGCEVRIWRYLFQPSLFAKLMHGSLLSYQYRLRGPHALTSQSKRVLNQLDVTLPSEKIRLSTLRVLKLKLGISNETSWQALTQWLYPSVKVTEEDIQRFSFNSRKPKLEKT